MQNQATFVNSVFYKAHAVPVPYLAPVYVYDYLHSTSPTTSLDSPDFGISGSGRWSAESVNEKMAVSRAPWDMNSLKAAIISADVGTGDVANAIRSCTFKPREQAFTKLISVCGRSEQPEKALEVYEAMLEVPELRPNTITYTALISACSATGNSEDAMDVFVKMKKAAATDPDCLPNEVTYSKIITVTESAGYYNFAVSCYREMKEQQIEADRAVYCSALFSCLETNCMEEAEEVVMTMHQKGYAANAATYARLIDYFAENKRWESALDLFVTMQKLDQRVDTECCRALMKAFELVQEADMAFQLLRAMWDEEIEVDTDTYISGLRAFAHHGKWEEALQTMKKMVLTHEAIPVEARKLILVAAEASSNPVVMKKLKDLFLKIDAYQHLDVEDKPITLE